MRRALVAFALLAGCAPTLRERAPDAGVPSVYPADLRPSGRAVLATEIAWRDFLLDPRLRALVEQALAANRDLGVATARIDEARAQYRLVRADLLPALNLRANANYGNGGGGGSGGTTNNPNPTNPVDPNNPDANNGGGAASGGGNSRRYQINLAVSQYELDFWGRLRSLSASARAAYLQTVEAQRAFQIALIADVAEAYLVDRELAERLQIADRTRADRQRSLRIATRRFEVGEGSRLEVEAERGLLAGAEAEAATLRQQALQNRNQLQFLIGQPLDPALPPPRPLAQQGLLIDIPAGLPSDLLTARPDVLAAEQALVAARANVDAARAAFLPRITLTGSAGFASSSLGSLFRNGIWSFVPALVQPLFDGGANRANLSLADARRTIAVLQYERAIQIAFREVADALAARATLAERVRALEMQAAAERERERLANLRFQAGEAAFTDVLDTRRQIFAIEQQLVAARREQLSASVTLYTALGGGLK